MHERTTRPSSYHGGIFDLQGSNWDLVDPCVIARIVAGGLWWCRNGSTRSSCDDTSSCSSGAAWHAAGDELQPVLGACSKFWGTKLSSGSWSSAAYSQAANAPTDDNNRRSFASNAATTRNGIGKGTCNNEGRRHCCLIRGKRTSCSRDSWELSSSSQESHLRFC